LAHFTIITQRGSHFLSWVVAELLRVVICSSLWCHRLLLLFLLLLLLISQGLLIDKRAVVIVEGLVVFGKFSPLSWLCRNLLIFSATADSVMVWLIWSRL
jgi:hypothetical protein